MIFLFRYLKNYILKVSCVIICSGTMVDANAQTFQLYHCMVDLEQPQKAVMKKYNIPEAILIDGRYIDPQRTGKVDSVFLVKSIRELFPSENATGMGLLDLEDENYEAIRRGGAKTVSFEQGMNEMMKMIRIAKSLRPRVNWSIYNLPFATYYDKDANWSNQFQRLKPLFEMVDVLTPSLYDFYPDTTEFTDDKTYFADNLRVSLQISKLSGKPVMPYVWHRWHDSNQKNGLLLIDEPEFKQDIRQMLEAEYEGARVSGLIWFGAQSSFYKIKPDLADKDRVKVRATKGKEKEKVLDVYAGYIKQVVQATAGKRKG
jgi:hypothetical protein